MRLLLDNNLSPQMVAILALGGHEVEHVRDHNLGAAPDDHVLAHAARHEQVLVSADTDFGQLLAQSGADHPSVVMIRTATQRRPDAQAQLLLDNLPLVAPALARGALVVLEDTRLRVRDLPMLGR